MCFGSRKGNFGLSKHPTKTRGAADRELSRDGFELNATKKTKIFKINCLKKTF